MMWYEIPGIPRYRINHRGEMMSLQGDWPVLLGYKEQVRLLVKGHYLTYDTKALVDLALAGIPLQVRQHHESARIQCDHGHDFTPENTMTRTGGYRMCRTCFNKRMRDYRRKRRARTKE